jgi:hypothetical protein
MRKKSKAAKVPVLPPPLPVQESWWRRWGSRSVAVASVVTAIVASVAGLITNGKSIGEAMGLIEKKQPLGIALLATSIFYEADPNKPKEATLILHVYKVGEEPARNCRMEGEWDGYQLPVKASSGASFTIPSGESERTIAVSMSPIKAHIGLKSPSVALICDNVGSEAYEFDW